jgi:hypothetical protein
VPFAGLLQHEVMPQKRVRSPYQKQIRFLIGLFIALIVLATILIMCLINLKSFSVH